MTKTSEWAAIKQDWIRILFFAACGLSQFAEKRNPFALDVLSQLSEIGSKMVKVCLWLLGHVN